MKLKIKNKIVLIDKENFDQIKKWQWQINYNGYVVRNHWNNLEKKYEKMYMHRYIMNTPKGFDTDHINRNKLDNRKSNLRIVTRSFNNFNSPKSKSNTSGTKGVNWFKPARLWRAYITINRKRIELGYTKTIFEAINLRKKAEIQYGI